MCAEATSVDSSGRTRFARRAFLRGALTVAGGMALPAALSGCGDDKRPQATETPATDTPTAPAEATARITTTPSATPSPTIAPTPSPTTTPVTPREPILRPAPAFRRITANPGQPLAGTLGVFFMRTDSGHVEGWLPTEESGLLSFATWDVSPDNSTIVGIDRGGVRNTAALVSRRAERPAAFTFSTAAWDLVGLSNRLLVFSQTRIGRFPSQLAHIGELRILRDFVEVASVSLPPDTYTKVFAVASPDENSVLILAGGESGPPMVFAFDLRRSQLVQTWSWGSSGETESIYSFSRQPGISGVSLLWAPRGLGLFHLQALRFRTDGSPRTDLTLPARADVSPDLKSYALQEFDIPPDGQRHLGKPAVAIYDAASGRRMLRVASAAHAYGDALVGTRWLADSSGLTVMVGDAASSSDDSRDHVKYALLRIGTSPRLEPLPPAERQPGRWWEAPQSFAPLPSPTSAELLCFGRSAAYNFDSKTWAVANIEDQQGPTHLSPWGSRADEMRVAVSHGGHHGDPPYLLGDEPTITMDA